jgi:hypothetical protein
VQRGAPDARLVQEAHRLKAISGVCSAAWQARVAGGQRRRDLAE